MSDETVTIIETPREVIVLEDTGEIIEIHEEITEVVEIARQGLPGASAYQIAVANGFSGTEAEWLDSLHAGGSSGGGGGINNIVEDTSPQLGGNLDLNGHEIFGALETNQFILDGGLL